MSDSPSAQPDPGGDPLVRLRNVSKQYGKIAAVEPLDLDIYRGDFLAILGPSGCGKTTLLRLIGGFIAPTTGRIEIAGTDVTRLAPERRPTNMVFQGYGLFPHMTVRQNIAYGLRIAKVRGAEFDQRIHDIMALVRLEEFAERSTDSLSGGQAQRVALARALVMRPQVLLLDEPLAALDLKLRKEMGEELRRIHRSIGGTFVFVTHDQGEALGLANRIAVMEDGNIVQEGGAEEVYSAPKTRFVSTFVGEANIFSGHREHGTVRLKAGVSIPDSGAAGPVIVVVRPEVIRLDADDAASDVILLGKLIDIIFSGPYVKFKFALDEGQQAVVHSSDLALRRKFSVGETVRIGWSLGDHRVLEDR